MDIPIIGQVADLGIKIGSLQIKIKKALVTSTEILYVMLGAPEIIENTSVLAQFMPVNNKNTINCNSWAVVQKQDTLLGREQEVKTRFGDLFASEITPAKMCNLKRHSIETGKHPPICQRGHRIQIHLEGQVDEEIQKLAKQGIIRKSESPWRSSLVVVPKDRLDTKSSISI